MKRPVLLTFAIVFMVAALAVSGILIASLSGRIDMSGFIKTGFSEFTAGELIAEKTFDASSLRELNISARDQRIAFIPTDDEFITVRQYDRKDAEQFSATETAGALNIKLDSKIGIIVANVTIPVLEIYVPASYTGSVSAASTSGGIICDGAVKWDTVDMNTNSGSIRFEHGIECNSIKADSTSGSVRIGSIDAMGLVRLGSTSGSVHVEGDVVCADFNAKSNSGSVRLGQVTATGKVEIASTSGTIHTGSVSSGSYDLKSRSGSIKTDSLRGMGSATASSGSISCGGLTITGDTQLQSTSGSVRVTIGTTRNLAVEVSTSSGSIRSSGYEFLYDASGKNGYCTIGDGSGGTLSIKTSSGSISLN